jgi:hypothetical protein
MVNMNCLVAASNRCSCFALDSCSRGWLLLGFLNFSALSLPGYVDVQKQKGAYQSIKEGAHRLSKHNFKLLLIGSPALV